MRKKETKTRRKQILCQTTTDKAKEMYASEKVSKPRKGEKRKDKNLEGNWKEKKNEIITMVIKMINVYYRYIQKNVQRNIQKEEKHNLEKEKKTEYGYKN